MKLTKLLTKVKIEHTSLSEPVEFDESEISFLVSAKPTDEKPYINILYLTDGRKVVIQFNSYDEARQAYKMLRQELFGDH